MNHQVNHSKLNHGFTTNRQRLIVFAQPSVLSRTRKGPFHHPSSGQCRKIFNVFITFDKLQHPVTQIESPVDQFTCISTIGPDRWGRFFCPYITKNLLSIHFLRVVTCLSYQLAIVIHVEHSLRLTGTNCHHHYKCAADKNVAKKIKN